MNTLQKRGKKGFTLTELAIVIAVIAILIAVLVPTFTSVINKANVTTAAENAHNALTEYTIETYDVLDDDSKAVVKAGDYYFTVTEDGTISTDDAYVSKTDNTSGLVAYTWTDSTFAGYGIATIYVSADYATTNYNFAGFIASAKAAALDSTNIGSSGANLTTGTTYYAAVTIGTNSDASYWFVLTYNTDAWTAAAFDEDTYDACKGTPTGEQTSYTGYSVVYNTVS